jgi:hypothetical protein
LCEGIGHPS